MKPRPAFLAPLAKRYDALQRRERVLVAAVAVLGPLLLGLSLFVDPQFARVRTLRNAIEQQRSTLADTRNQVTLLETQAQADPDGPKKAELAGLQRQLAESDQRLLELRDTLVAPEEMNRLLERLLVHHGGLRLVSLRTLPPESILGAPSKGEGKTEAKVAQERQFDIYRHGVEMRLEGGYLELLGYLEQLEKAERKLLWGAVQLTVVAHPKARMTLTVYTLGSDKTWLAI
ncbi:MAG TPA: type II secretion system protein GspM [Rhodocyclaceae bacterium]|jgi:MSHA biogenesis protein MshJ|nr:type II secretion system protein GspM [Rhodocyclaceae bacterium]HMV21182.1 type II secretion system protein GspM [Rhodocyclaceae bacterium]HMW78179.1 type II secretion system protein GspM [Rhodocyclaceae bacterium]HNE42339.1 type II secretion system protein GspM [Rhodocyclaceae bacterium]HNL21909.1 type II secretion system protein GspM [Rhodocyclaceae bacterium]